MMILLVISVVVVVVVVVDVQFLEQKRRDGRYFILDIYEVFSLDYY
jgi:hypothetical protein